MLLKITEQGKIFTIIPREELGSTSNIFTVIIGKNGSGKSRILKKLADFATIERRIMSVAQTRMPRGFFSNSLSTQVKSSTTPTKIICVSTNPFDKFTLPKIRKDNDAYYHYLGIRGLPNTNVGQEYIGRIIYTLINAIQRQPDTTKIIKQTLNYLGFEDGIDVSFKLTSPAFIKKIQENEISTLTSFKALPNRFNIGVNISNKNDLATVINYSREITASANFGIKIQLNEDGLRFEPYLQNQFISNNPDTLLALAKHNFLKIDSVSLKKENMIRRFRLEDASSGEQSIVMSLLAISAEIENNALICIDEPEVCLHPEWQERYIDLLTTLFSKYTGCQFIIATHSPQIISKLPKNNCFILQMESGEALSSADYSQKSSDYQLANLFKAPGFKNEYLSRELITALSIIGTGDSLKESQIQKYRTLLELKNIINQEDPIFKMMEILEHSLTELGL